MKHFFLSLLLSILVVSSGLAQEKVYIPESLKPWEAWVRADLSRGEFPPCTELGGSKECIWSGDLSIDVENSSARFSYQVTLEHKGEVDFPGNGIFGVEDLSVTSAQQPVDYKLIQRGERLRIALPKGQFSVAGTLRWTEQPQSISLPPQFGKLQFHRNGETVTFPEISDSNTLWLGAEEKEQVAIENSLRVLVFRVLEDGVPFTVETIVSLRIGGRAREIALGDVLPNDGIPFTLESPLPARLDRDAGLVVQARPGQFDLKIRSLFPTPPTELSPQPSSTLPEWPEDEIWVFKPNEQLRTVALKGGVPTDPNRTALPDNLKSFRAFYLKKGDVFQLEQTRRGERSVPPNSLSLRRSLWLDLNGVGFTVKDDITGTMNSGFRLNAQNSLKLGRVSLEGESVLITEDVESKKRGVELREQNLQMEAVSRLSRDENLPSVGWQHDVSSLSTSLFVPPGWNLIAASGCDSVFGSWMSSWSLLTLFFLGLIVIGAQRLFGWKLAGILAVVLVLSHDIPKAPYYLWVHLLLANALTRYLPEGGSKRIGKRYQLLTLVALGSLIVAFVSEQVLFSIYPQLNDLPGGFGELCDFVYQLTESSFVTWLFIVLIVIGLIELAQNIRTPQKKVSVFKLFLSVLLVGFLLFVFFVLQLTSSGGRRVASRFQQVASSLEEGANYKRSYSDEMVSLAAPQDKALRKKLYQQDPKAVIQTGPGLPAWSGKTYTLGWDGPVSMKETFSLFLISPFLNMLIGLLRAALSVLFLWLTFQTIRKHSGVLPLLLLVTVFSLMPRQLFADDFPSKQMLDELRTRIETAEGPTCKKNCTTISEINVSPKGEELILDVTVEAQKDSAFAVPGPLTHLALQSVQVDGKVHRKLMRDGKGYLWIAVPEGKHSVQVKALLPEDPMVSLQFIQLPLAVSTAPEGWRIDGVSPYGRLLQSQSLELTRLSDQSGGEDNMQSLQPVSGSEGVLTDWFQVRRELVIDLPWKVITTVTRLESDGAPVSLRVPLLEGEAVNSEAVTVEDGLAKVSFRGGMKSVQWESNLVEVDRIALAAPKRRKFNEVWSLVCSPIWRCETEGIPPTHSLQNGEQAWSWNPFPSEEVAIHVTRPLGAEGEAVTIDSLDLVTRPGDRLTTSTVRTSIRASRGGNQSFTIPKSARIRSVTINGRVETTRFEGSSLDIPLVPGANDIVFVFDQADALGLWSSLPKVSFSGTAYNVRSQLSVPGSKWLLGAFGPSWGPVVLYWPRLFLIVLAAICLSRLPLTPLSAVSWVILGLGLSEIHLIAAAIPVLWLFAIKIRKEKPFDVPFAFNLWQIILFGLTLLSLAILYEAIRRGLILRPDISVYGNGSSSHLLSWYNDRVEGELPNVSVIWFPVLVWNLLMVAWAGWLAFHLLNWLRNGFEAFGEGGYWKRGRTENTASNTETQS